MQTNHPKRLRNFVRPGLYIALFVCLSLASLSAAWPTLSAQAAVFGSVPAAATIPPAGTIPGPLEGQVNVLHLAPFDADVANTGVEVCDTADNPVSDVLYYEDETGYETLPVGTYNWKVALAGSNCTNVPLEIPSFRLKDQQRLLIIIYGDITNQPLNLVFVIVDAGRETTYLPLFYRALVDQAP